jgi:SAM-dependent methyltransferase
MSINSVLPLNDAPNDSWLRKYEEVISDPYIKKKYNRSRRLKDKFSYLQNHLPFLKEGGNSVLDIGPGPGEFLEACRYYGNEARGSDALIDDCEMGDSYITLSRLMSERQGLDILYNGLDMSIYKDESFDVINSQGSIEQVLRDLLEGVPHKEKKNCMLLSWRETRQTEVAISRFLSDCYRCLRDNGVLLIYGNGAKNVEFYDSAVCYSCREVGFNMIKRKNHRFHLMRKSS